MAAINRNGGEERMRENEQSVPGYDSEDKKITGMFWGREK